MVCRKISKLTDTSLDFHIASYLKVSPKKVKAATISYVGGEGASLQE